MKLATLQIRKLTHIQNGKCCKSSNWQLFILAILQMFKLKPIQHCMRLKLTVIVQVGNLANLQNDTHLRELTYIQIPNCLFWQSCQCSNYQLLSLATIGAFKQRHGKIGNLVIVFKVTHARCQPRKLATIELFESAVTCKTALTIVRFGNLANLPTLTLHFERPKSW